MAANESTLSRTLIDTLPHYPEHPYQIDDWHVHTGAAVVSLRMPLPVLTPYFNRWGADVYQRETAFDDVPDQIATVSTSGSVVVLGYRGFAGIHGRGSVRITHDGKETLTIHAGNGITIYTTEHARGFEGWRNYNDAIGLPPRPNISYPHYFYEPEYNTWVEQVRRDKNTQKGDVLDDALVDDFMDEIDRLSLPRGKFVIDFGWHTGRSRTMSDWLPDAKRFPSMARTADRIAKRGFTPGLWLAPAQIGSESIFGRKYPQAHCAWTAPAAQPFWADTLAMPCEEYRRFCRETFTRVIEWGFRKFKLDLFYGPRRHMIDLLNIISEEIHGIDSTVEIESHIPDAAVSPFCQVVRTNDVNVNDKMDWRRVTIAHFRICEWSSPHRIINYDFIGGNDPTLTEEHFNAHAELFHSTSGIGYACIGLLPGHFDHSTIARFKKLVDTVHSI